MTRDLQRLLPLLPRDNEPGLWAVDVRNELGVGRKYADSLLKALGRVGLAVFMHPRQVGRRLGGWRAA